MSPTQWRRLAGVAAALALFGALVVAVRWRQPAAPSAPVDAQLQRTLERLLTQMRAGDDEGAAAALVAIGPAALPALRQALRDPDEDFRVSVLETAQKIGGAAAVGVLLAALTDADEDVRLTAVEGLGAVPDRRAVAPLLALYRRDDDQQVRYECLTSLGRIGDPAAAELLVAETHNDDANARGWAIEALCHLDDA